MQTADLVVLALSLFAALVFVAMGIPCSRGWVGPNSLFGFRTRKTLHDPVVWYAANRIAGYWSIVTGIVAAGVCLTTFFTRLGLPAAAWVNVVPFLLGIVGLWTHCLLVIARVSREKRSAVA